MANKLSAHGGCSSVGRALGCGPRGRGFKSLHPPHLRNQLHLRMELFLCPSVSEQKSQNQSPSSPCIVSKIGLRGLSLSRPFLSTLPSCRIPFRAFPSSFSFTRKLGKPVYPKHSKKTAVFLVPTKACHRHSAFIVFRLFSLIPCDILLLFLSKACTSRHLDIRYRNFIILPVSFTTLTMEKSLAYLYSVTGSGDGFCHSNKPSVLRRLELFFWTHPLQRST